MKVEIISVGTELLLGDIINTNAPYLANECADLGLDCYYQTVIGDNHDRLLEQTRVSIERSDVVIFTGGLGPTYDDITKETVAEALGETLIFDQTAYDLIAEYFNERGKRISENNRKQAYTFKDSMTIYNEVGTAPAHVVMRAGKIIVLLPGPPYEMQYNFEKKVKPLLREITGDTIVSQSLYLINIGESELETMIYDLMKLLTNPTIAPYALSDGVKLRVTAKAKSRNKAVEMIAPVVDYLKQLLSEYLYSVDEERIEIVLSELLNRHQLTMSVIDCITDGSVVMRLKDGGSYGGSSVIQSIASCATVDAFEETVLKLKKDYEKHQPSDLLLILVPCEIGHSNVGVSVWMNHRNKHTFLAINTRVQQKPEIFRHRVGSRAFKVVMDFIVNSGIQ